jgi:glycosyltransferase involved in cell wall biosynthesis
MRNLIGLSVTPVVLTYNEELNIERTLESLRWAERIVVLDSGSTDATQAIAKRFSNVDWRVRRFDSFKEQYEYAIHVTDISTKYVLALDADMAVSEKLLQEIESAFLSGNFEGGLFSFEFRIDGHALAGSLYPAQARLFLRNKVRVVQHGHGHKFEVDGPIHRFKFPLIHDDRKPLERWVSSQLSYSTLEATRITAGVSYKWRDWFRQFGLMPLIVGVLAYVRAGGPWRGAAAVRYAYERAAYECLLSIRLMSSRLEKNKKSSE